MKPELSIVVMTWNRREVLRRCLKYLEEYTQMSHEVIVVDDHSEDRTPEMVRDEFPDAKLIVLDEHTGCMERNRGFEIAQGAFIGEVDDDVMVFPMWDRIVMREMDDDVGMVGQQGMVFKGWGEPNVGKLVKPGNCADFITGFIFICRNLGIYYDPRFNPRFHGDLDLSFQWLAKGWKLKICRPCCAHPSMMPEVDWKLHDAHLDLIREKWETTMLPFQEFDQRRHVLQK